MKRFRLFFITMLLSLCVLGLTGCGNDESDGSVQSGTGGETGVMDNLGDKVETMVDDMSSAVDDMMN